MCIRDSSVILNILGIVALTTITFFLSAQMSSFIKPITSLNEFIVKYSCKVLFLSLIHILIEITAEIRAFIDKAAAGVELAEDEYIDLSDGLLKNLTCS